MHGLVHAIHRYSKLATSQHTNAYTCTLRFGTIKGYRVQFLWFVVPVIRQVCCIQYIFGWLFERKREQWAGGGGGGGGGGGDKVY